MKTQLLSDSQLYSRVSSEKVTPDDPRYADLVRRGFNKRFVGKPDYVRLVGSTEQVVEALQEAVREGLRVVVRSGGHCLEGFVADPAVRVVIDTSLMTSIYYDTDMGAFAVEAGATVGEMYRKLFLGWGVTVPAGISPDIGVGGHIVGGAFGYLCRQLGLAADYLYAVEVVVVDETGTAKSVIATREPSDPNRDLWWAHTGGGGGNFGIVTRYWFRSSGAEATDPANQLPNAPQSVLRFKAAWNWEAIDESAFTRLLQNHGDWCERNSDAESPFANLYSTFFLPRRPAGKIEITGVLTAGAASRHLLDEHLAAINQGVGVTPTSEAEVDTISWLAFALYPFPDLVDKGSQGGIFKIKDAFLCKRLTDRQIGVAYRYLNSADDVAGGLGMATYGGKVNTIAPDATASAQREAILTMSCSTGWGNPQDESQSLTWVREFYRDLFADTGGVPVPGEASNGALINHPDVDLADPAWNTSGIPWQTLYYKDNYPRLQQIKSRWDPLNIFHHALSIHPT
ncbi:MAG: FAD-binding protein [Chloroflexota bacterium]